MLLYRTVKATDMPLLNQFFSNENAQLEPHLSYLHNSMLLEVDNQILGFAAYRLLSDTKAHLMYILIAKDYRGNRFGDGLVKALLNTAEQRGVLEVFANDHTLDDGSSLLDRLGFERISEQGVTHVAKLPHFFETACASKKGR